MCKTKCVYLQKDGISIRVQTNGKPLTLETIQAIKKMAQLAYNHKTK